MGQFWGKVCSSCVVASILALGGQTADGQTITDRIAFRVPPVVVAWSGAQAPMRGERLHFPVDPSGCVTFASNAGVSVNFEHGPAEATLRAVFWGRSARQAQGIRRANSPGLVFPQRTAIAPDTIVHQSVRLCLFQGDEPLEGGDLAGIEIALFAFDDQSNFAQVLD